MWVCSSQQGFYWPEVGPANTMYIPGPLLKPCNNEIVMLELGVATKANVAPAGEIACQLKPLFTLADTQCPANTHLLKPCIVIQLRTLD